MEPPLSLKHLGTLEPPEPMNPATSETPEPGANGMEPSNLETSITLELVEPELEPRNLWNQINLEFQIVGISRTCETYKPLEPVEPWTENCKIFL